MVKTKSSFKVLLENIPKNTGDKAFYVFSVPPISQDIVIDEVTILFPQIFSPNLANSHLLECGFMPTTQKDLSFINYLDLLKIT